MRCFIVLQIFSRGNSVIFQEGTRRFKLPAKAKPLWTIWATIFILSIKKKTTTTLIHTQSQQNRISLLKNGAGTRRIRNPITPAVSLRKAHPLNLCMGHGQLSWRVLTQPQNGTDPKVLSWESSEEHNQQVRGRFCCWGCYVEFGTWWNRNKWIWKRLWTVM